MDLKVVAEIYQFNLPSTILLRHTKKLLSREFHPASNKFRVKLENTTSYNQLVQGTKMTIVDQEYSSKGTKMTFVASHSR